MIAKVFSGAVLGIDAYIVEVEVDRKGHIVLTPKKLVDAGQAYFWTEEWQKGERKADEDIKAGRVKRFKSAAEAVEYLERKA